MLSMRMKDNDDDNQDEDKEEGSAEGEKEKLARERRKSARLQTKEEFRVTINEPKKRRKLDSGEAGGSDKEAEGEGDKKKRPKYARAPLGSLANPNWDGMLGIDHQSKWQELLKKEKLTPLEMMQEAAFTEVINKRSLEALYKLENDRV